MPLTEHCTGTEYVDYDWLNKRECLCAAVIKAVLEWDKSYLARASSIPVDDELHFAAQALISAYAEHNATQNDTNPLT